MLIRYGCKFTISCIEPTPMVCFLDAREDAPQCGPPRQRFETSPAVAARTYRDGYGNTGRRFVIPPGETSIAIDGTIAHDGRPDPVAPEAREVPVEALPDECMPFLLGSRYCDTDRLSQTAWDLFDSTEPGWARVQAICAFTHNRLAFDYMQASETRTACDAFEQQVGVCRDYAHLAVALCRCMNIPARYVSGYLGNFSQMVHDPLDMNAWIEVYLDQGWLTFDPRHNTPLVGRIAAARGRDAADVPLIHSFGPHVLTGFEVWTEEAGGPGAAA
ncbi:transglutaminase [Marinicauda salina]|uniref:Transglutaminase n=1 Tax=Marinicauda salina TaxID=2135793 RepID=A0A2U2BS63_9PROT|nr:transglutaminase family protein [Marinicauda salina]PWE16861.1 transglutaminase [Marinicauda salina]